MVITGHLKDVVNKDIRWLWKPFIPFGKVTMIQGDTGIGKTNVVVKIMADISNGVYPPTMEADHLLPQVEGEPVKIYYVSVENGIDDTIAPVFDQFGGNRENVMYQDEAQGHFVLILDKANGFVGRTVIHPTHVKFVNAMMAVTKEEYDDACQILGTGGGVVKGSGGNKMNEIKPHTNWAKKVYNRARAYGVIRDESGHVKLFAVND